MAWRIRVEAKGKEGEEDEKKDFLALDVYEVTEEQKLLWKTLTGKEVLLTGTRIKTVLEEKEKDT
jgi:hypothetical protein